MQNAMSCCRMCVGARRLCARSRCCCRGMRLLRSAVADPTPQAPDGACALKDVLQPRCMMLVLVQPQMMLVLVQPQMVQLLNSQ